MSANPPTLPFRALADAAVPQAGHPPLAGQDDAIPGSPVARRPMAGAVPPAMTPTGGAVAGRALLALLRQG